MTWLWVAGGVVLVAGALAPPLLSARRTRNAGFATARDTARSLMSQLESAVDSAGSDVEQAALTEANRCLLLAGSALGGKDTVDGFRRAAGWARSGLLAIGVSHH